GRGADRDSGRGRDDLRRAHRRAGRLPGRRRPVAAPGADRRARCGPGRPRGRHAHAQRPTRSARPAAGRRGGRSTQAGIDSRRRRMTERLYIADVTVGSLMTRPVVSVRPDTTVAAPPAFMAAHPFNGFPVVDELGVLQGLVTRVDLLKRHLAPYRFITALDEPWRA